jgi:Leucine rich repeat
MMIDGPPPVYSDDRSRGKFSDDPIDEFDTIYDSGIRRPSNNYHDTTEMVSTDGGDGVHRTTTGDDDKTKAYWTTPRGRRFLQSSFLGAARRLRSRSSLRATRDVDNPYSARKQRTSRFYIVVGLFVVVIVALLGWTTSPKKTNDDGISESPDPNSNVTRAADFDTVVFYLNRQGVTHRNHTTEVGSPSNRAVHWIVNVDPANMAVPRNQRTGFGPGYQFMIRYIMALLYYQYVDSHEDEDKSGRIAQFTKEMHWLSDKHICDWRTETKTLPSGVKTFSGVACNDEQVVVGLSFDHLSLKGTLVTEIGHFWSLKSFDAAENHIYGTIPPEICASGLRRLTLNNNSLTGSLPSCLGNMEALETLSLSSNQLTGTLPEFFESLALMKQLALDHNNFSGNATSAFHRMTRLEYLLVSDSVGVYSFKNGYFFARHDENKTEPDCSLSLRSTCR